MRPVLQKPAGLLDLIHRTHLVFGLHLAIGTYVARSRHIILVSTKPNKVHFTGIGELGQNARSLTSGLSLACLFIVSATFSGRGFSMLRTRYATADVAALALDPPRDPAGQ